MTKQKLPRYEMHKYWGKKPANELDKLIEKYSKVGDIVMDPFAGYGVFVSESYLKGRNAIGNDLNPASVFIQKNLLNKSIDLKEFQNVFKDIFKKLKGIEDEWFSITCPQCNSKAKVISTLRNKQNTPLMNKIKCSCSRKSIEVEISDMESKDFLNRESEICTPEHPNQKLIRNGRISVLDKMTTDDLFTNRTLLCQAIIFEEILNIKEPIIRNLAKFTFTSNLANSSKLVPPIKSRGPMAPGAWMTGYYIGDTYLENNTFHYLANRVKKVIDGKNDFLNTLREKKIKDQGECMSVSEFSNDSSGYLILNQDTKNLEIQDASIDYIFTDPPYGDTVPYFEQSALWNTWLGFDVDYENEVVISDSKVRGKTAKQFSNDIHKCIEEITRVLKNDGYFSITFHSLSGEEWYSLTKACLENNLILEDLVSLTQKTFSPRQLNRKTTVKGDILITFKKSNNNEINQELSEDDTISLVCDVAEYAIRANRMSTNDIYIDILTKIYKERLLIKNINFIEALYQKFDLSELGDWSLKV